MSKKLICAFTGVVCVSLLIILPLRAQDDSQVEEVFQKMDQSEGTALWDHAMTLEDLGPGAAKEISRRMTATRRDAVRVAAAKALLSMEGADAQRPAAIRALKQVVRTGTERGLRVRACQLLTAYGLRKEVRQMYRDLDTIRDPIVKIHLLKALYVRGRHPRANRTLKGFLRSDDLSVRCEAALVLASPEIGNVDVGKEILRKLKDEPTDRGRRARAYLEMDDMLDKLEKYEGLETRDEILKLREREIADLKGEIARLKSKKGAGGDPGVKTPGGALFEELFRRVRDLYVDEKKTETNRLIDEAARGLIDSLDPFSSYMNEKAVADFNTGIGQRYGGIGAVVQMDRESGYLTIQRPIYGNPAYQSGLRTFDEITKVEDVSTKDKTVQELVKILKGPEGTKVRVWVKPFLPRELKNPVEITRKSITLKSVRWDMMPGNIGYLQLSQFGHLATAEVEEALVDLERRGMQGLIFDLRGNPGGLLSAAVEIADKFLPDDKLVVYAKGRKGTRYGARQEDGGPQVKASRLRQKQHPQYPIIVLIDEDSASASEIVAGALQAHKRAELVGEQTFGKGSVQNIFPLASKQGKAALRMTIAYYYLPDGRLIHRPREVETWRFRNRMRREIRRWQQDGLLSEAQAKELNDKYKALPGGVEPDYRVENPELGVKKQKAYAKLYDKNLFREYIRANWRTHQKTFHALALHDHFEHGKYPGFEKLWEKALASLDKPEKDVFTRNDLRIGLRATVRRFAQDDLARDLTSDYQQDQQMQAALLLMAGKVGHDVEDLPRLKFIKKTFPKGVARTRKAAKRDRDFK